MALAYNVRAFSSAPITCEVNAANALATLARLGAGMRNPGPVVEGLARAMRQHVRTAFAVGGFPTPWAPNKLNTVVAKGHSKPLFRSRGGSGIQAATSITVAEVGREFSIVARTSAVGRFHQEGRQGPWTITPKNAPRLVFQVAGGRAAFRQSRSRAQSRRARTGRGTIPGRPGSVTVYALSVQHPGYPARPFLPNLDPGTSFGNAFLQKHWRTPLRTYLFGERR